ncbi:beta-ketoacyl synthase N-terminal-like domain-containing protein, partial [Streptomyces zhihengii]
IDPQQRLMLEVGWRAIEDAGQRAAALAGTRTAAQLQSHLTEAVAQERMAAACTPACAGQIA